MNDYTPTFTFEGDQVFAIYGGKVIASGSIDNMETVESDAVDYLDSLKNTHKNTAKANAKKSATHVITPNGIKGEILGRTPDLWGEQLTIRLANGSITRYTVHGETEIDWVTEKKASAANPATALKDRLSEDFEHDADSLTARYKELNNVSIEAHRLASAGAPYSVTVELDQVRIAAEAEARQVKEAIDHLDSADAESFIPDAPFAPRAVEQADLGRSDSWLDTVAQDMISESEAVDTNKLLSEGPALFVTDLDTGTLADTGTTRDMALAHVTAKTAGFTGEEIDGYRQSFIARVEVARRQELAARKEVTKKTAAVEEQAQADTPDDALFL